MVLRFTWFIVLFCCRIEMLTIMLLSPYLCFPYVLFTVFLFPCKLSHVNRKTGVVFIILTTRDADEDVFWSSRREWSMRRRRQDRGWVIKWPMEPAVLPRLVRGATLALLFTYWWKRPLLVSLLPCAVFLLSVIILSFTLFSPFLSFTYYLHTCSFCLHLVSWSCFLSPSFSSLFPAAAL